METTKLSSKGRVILPKHITLAKIDRLVERHVFSNRSRAIQEAVTEKLARLEKGRLALACAKLDPAFERALAEGLSEDLAAWPEY